ncbi:hypothetical protein WDU94_015342 [Cyamophila willieti]
MAGRNQNTYPQQQFTENNDRQIFNQLKQLVQNYDDTPRMNPRANYGRDSAPEERQRRQDDTPRMNPRANYGRDLAPEERQRRQDDTPRMDPRANYRGDLAPEERQRRQDDTPRMNPRANYGRDLAPEERQRRQDDTPRMNPRENYGRDFAPEERQRRQDDTPRMNPRENYGRDFAPEERQRRQDPFDKPVETYSTPALGEYQQYECMDTESQMRRIIPARDPALNPACKRMKVTQEECIIPGETVSAPLIRTYPQGPSKPQNQTRCSDRMGRQTAYMGARQTTKVESPWCKRNGLQDRWNEDPKYRRKRMDIYSTPYPCCEFQSWPYDQQSHPAGLMAFNQKNDQYKREEDCCRELSGRPTMKSSQREEYVQIADCEKTSLCHTQAYPSAAIRRPRDIVPVHPREHVKPNCQFK